MSLLDSLKRALGREAPQPTAQPAPARGAEVEEPRVPEITGAELLAARQNGHGLVLLDCREDHEWRQGRIPGSLHIPMRQVPGRLNELRRDAEIVVVCAHGNRSYSVAGWLIQNGYGARSLKGGVADWQWRGYAIETSMPEGS
jgi:rhodanese-related sulfurtransferase